MITRGSKFFYGAAALSLFTGLVYGFITGAAAHGGVLEVFSNGGLVNSILGPLSFGWKGWVGDQIGYSVFMGFAAIMAVFGGFQSAFRDGDAEALVQLQGPGVTAETADLRVVQPQGLSYWPLVMAFSVGAIIVGLAVSSIVFVIGCLGLGIAGIEWTVRAWSERASDDAAANVEQRNKFMHPIEVPVGATIAAAAVVFLMSRILLAVSKVGAVFVIIGVAVAVFGVAVLLASRPQLKRSVLVGALLVFGVLLIGGGIIGGIAGPAEREHHGEEHGSEEGMPAVVIRSDHGRTSGSIGLDGSTVGY